MKTYSNLFPQIYDFESLHRAYLRARKGKREHADVLRFERDLEGELIQLQNELIWNEYKTGTYRSFHVFEPKRRLVAALPFRDRVVQHSIIAAIEPIWESRFIHHSYACRPGRGMHSGANQAQKWLREVLAAHGHVYVLKADVAKYFPSIDHDILIEMLSRRIACQRTMGVLSEIIDTWHPGLPIGNLTSQLCANIYLHELDLHVKQDLRVKRYIRYMDDWLVVHHDKQYLHDLRRRLEAWIWSRLRLRLNNKTQVFPVGIRNGRALDFLGYRMWPTHRRLRNDSIKRMVRRLGQMQRAYEFGLIDVRDVQQRLASWLGHASHADSYRIRKKVLGEAVFRRGD